MICKSMVAPVSPILKREDGSRFFSSSGLRESSLCGQTGPLFETPTDSLQHEAHIQRGEEKRREEKSFCSFESEGEARSGLALP